MTDKELGHASDVLHWIAVDSDGEMYGYPTEPFLERGTACSWDWDYIGKGEFCHFLGKMPIEKDLTEAECLATKVKVAPFVVYS
ncbi:hypothetical protein KNV05_gp070 [Vibrio phage River4]|uniref:Uncharacterized protein n=1 Tax=Vibrio phage River4 TaxID=2736288 RepID=A0A6M9YZY8_9CAUD|nr:hypothetical protein KNV05_gp070 [Vibrio phage River4]QKN84732.1 hypothetical protein RIVER4_70 [Vibrio phage River4]